MKRYIRANEIYEGNEYDKDQMQEIREGLDQGLDVSVYADPKFSGDQMWQIRWGLEDGVDVSVYADPDYTWWQMKRIREKLEKGQEVDLPLPVMQSNFDWDKEYSIEECFSWDLSEEYSDEDLINIVEDNGYEYHTTLKEACEPYYQVADGDIDEMLHYLDADLNNGVGDLPLVSISYPEDALIQYVKTFHPEALNKPENAEYAKEN